jgi:ferredoxin-NADP reductase
VPQEHACKILMKEFVTHDVNRFIVEKPQGFKYLPGQATEVSINSPELKNEKRPFTFSSFNDDHVLEFTIKSYPQHEGVTDKLSRLKPGDELIIREVWGTINYKGPGVFIAGGAGITPFIAILRDLKNKGEVDGNTILFSNKEWKDIILERELKEILGEKAIFTLTKEKRGGYEHGQIDKEFIQKHVNDFNQNFYICGPIPFVVDIKRALDELGVKPESVVVEL